jgi:hypothetical protein
MYKFLVIAGLAGMLSAVPRPAAAEAPFSGSATVDLTGLTTALENGAVSFSGWQFLSYSSVTVGGSVTSLLANTPDSSAATLGAGAAATTFGQVQIESEEGATASAIQSATGMLTLAGGQTFTYAVPYTFIMRKVLFTETVNTGFSFTATGGNTPYTVGRNTGTWDWRVPLGTGSESYFVSITLSNTSNTPRTYALNTTLWSNTESLSPVPEPSGGILLLAGLGLLVCFFKKTQDAGLLS